MAALIAAGCGMSREEAEGLARRAELRREEGQLEEAYKLSQEAVSAAPSSPLVQEEAGRSALAAGLHAKAIEHLKRSVHLGDSPRRRGFLARALLVAGKVDAAADALDDALAQDAYDLDLRREAVYVYAMTGRQAEALRIGEDLLRQDRGNPATSARVAHVLVRAGRKEEARVLLRAVDPADVDQLQDLVILGSSLYEIQEAERAVAAFQQAHERVPEDPGILYNLGNAQVLAKDLRAAKVSFGKALEVRPDDAQSRGQLAYCLLHTGRRETAEKEIARALELDPSDPTLRMLAAEIRSR